MSKPLQPPFFLRTLNTSAIMLALGLLGCSDAHPSEHEHEGGEAHDHDYEAGEQVVRRSASEMRPEEIDRFVRAFEYAVAQGYFDDFNDSHNNHHHQRHHGADVQATSPITIVVMPREWGFRLLPWHRAFLLEAETMLREALRERNLAEGRDPAEAELLYIPYWDAAHDQALPQWVLDFQPAGGTAFGVEGLPEGHAGYGTSADERYEIEFGRWPGQNPTFDTLNTPEHIGRILAHDDFEGFYDALDTNPEPVPANAERAKVGLITLATLMPDNAAVQTLIASLTSPPDEADSDATLATTNALFELAHLEALETRKTEPDLVIIGAVEDVFSVFEFMPHVRMHLWAGGLDPVDASVRGTVTYFNELTVDPVFWMIHCELDRIWYSWEAGHDEAPPLTDDDAIFEPLAHVGHWYGGGWTFGLDELTDHDNLGYRYDTLFE